ncbi:MAG: helix-turn-helix transcriptional regulator [Bdellovibrionia bacterium]
MLNTFAERQQDLLKLLLKKKQGLQSDEIAAGLKISRPALRQHLVALERQGYVERGELLVTGGRPSQTYRLTRKGLDLFPKQYSWYSEAHLENLKKELGSAGLRDEMERLGREIGMDVAAKVSGENLKARVEQVASLMNDLAYQAETTLTGKELPGAPPVIEASNCVFHTLASKYSEICQFDIGLLSQLTEAQVNHEQCILRGGNSCRFRFKDK